ncbi:MAG TPA: hypothetical protein VF392_14310 [Terracidiphilus sp.]
MQLHEIAHSRTGDKGSFVTISVIAYRPEDFQLLRQALTTQRISELFAALIDRPADRYELPKIAALNFALHRPDSEAVTRSLALDAHGKCLGSALLSLEI